MTLPEIFKTNKIATNQDEAFALQLITQSAQAYQLMKLRKLEESKIPTGLKTIKVTVTPSEPLKYSFADPLISVSIINDGTGSLSAWINGENDNPSAMLESGENISIDMKYPVIETLDLKAIDSNCITRIIGKVGRRG